MKPSMQLRHDWTNEEIKGIYNIPLLDLIYKAASVHREYNDTGEVQVCTLLSIKTGGCSEDCAYCPQAARYDTGVDVQALLKKKKCSNMLPKLKMPAAQDFAWVLPGEK